MSNLVLYQQERGREGGRERESCQPTEWELDKHDMQLIETYLVTAEWEHHTTAHKVEERTNKRLKIQNTHVTPVTRERDRFTCP